MKQENIKLKLSLHFKYAFYWVQKSAQIISVQLSEMPQSEHPYNQHPDQDTDSHQLPELPVCLHPQREPLPWHDRQRSLLPGFEFYELYF